MKTKVTIIEKATEFARRVSENCLMCVIESRGSYFLAVMQPEIGPDSRRTLMAVGNVGWGIRHIQSEIETYFAGK